LNYYALEHDEALESLHTSRQGLTVAEAEARLARDGKNKLIEGKKTTLLQRFLGQLADPMIIVLLVAAALSGITSAYAGESFADVFIILFVVILNAVLGVLQESKAEEAIAALREMTASTCKVWRDGQLTHIKSEDLVPGDVITLEAVRQHEGRGSRAYRRIRACAQNQRSI